MLQIKAIDVSKIKDKIIMIPVLPKYASRNELSSKPTIPICIG